MKDKTTKVLLSVIAIGIWGLFLQNSGVLPTKTLVYVKGGNIDANVNGEVDANIYNTIDVNLHEINGMRDVFYNNPNRGEKDKYYLIPVTSQ